MFNWLRRPKPEPETPEPPPRRSGMFSTDVVQGDDKLPDLMSERLLQIRAAQPKRIQADGTAMDSADEFGELDAEGNGTPFNIWAQTGGMSPAVTGWFLSQGFIGHQMAGMLAQHWLIDKCCSVPARDAVRHGYEITTSDGDEIEAPEVLALMKRLDKKYRIKHNLTEMIYKGKIFGIRVCFLKIESTDPKFYELEFNLDGVTPGSYRGIVQVDPYWCMPELDAQASSNPATQHFYEPTYWVINGKRYHRSHLIVYREGDVVDILKPVYLYGGIPLPQKIMERVYCAERTANEGPQLAMTKRTRVMGTELDAGVALGPRYRQRLAEQSELLDNYATLVVDKDDKFEQFDTTLADLDAVTMNQFQLVAAAACVPGTKLLMTQPKGFNATGEYDEAVYHEELESIQEGYPTELVDRHHAVLMISDVVPYMRRKVDEKFEPIKTTITWCPLDSVTEKEQAEINKLKADTAQVLMNCGAIDEYDERDRIRTDKHSGYTGIVEVLRPDEDGNGEPDAPKLQAAAAAPAMGGFDAMDNDPLLITNQIHLDAAVVQQKREAGDYTVQVSPVIVDEQTGGKYRVVIDGHHSLEAARLDGVPPQLVEGGYGESDYFDVETGDPLR